LSSVLCTTQLFSFALQVHACCTHLQHPSNIDLSSFHCLKLDHLNFLTKNLLGIGHPLDSKLYAFLSFQPYLHLHHSTPLFQLQDLKEMMVLKLKEMKRLGCSHHLASRCLRYLERRPSIPLEMLDHCLQILQALLAGTAQYCLGTDLHGSLLVRATSSSSLDCYCVGNDHGSLDEYAVVGSSRDNGVAENSGGGGGAALYLCLLDLMN
jgi:hypothetical protein